MEKRTIHIIILSITLIASIFGVLFITSSHNKASAINTNILNLPNHIGTWSGKEVAMDERVYEILGTDKVLFREYTNPQKEKVWLCIVYGEQNRQSFHPPEYCYLGSGDAELLEKEKVNIAIVDKGRMSVNKLIFQKDNFKQLVLYWYTATNKSTSNYYLQQLQLLINEIRGRRNGGALIRISTFIIEDSASEATNRIERFIKEADQVLATYL